MESFLTHYGYWALFFVSVATSACIPLPSEVAFALAGALCSSKFNGHTHLNFTAVLFWGTVGSLVGSVITYEVGRTAGRAIVDRFGKWILLTHRDLDQAEDWFEKYGTISVFLGRLIPVIRAVISLPAGLAEMNRVRFWILSTVGGFLWVLGLAYLGRAAGNTHFTTYLHNFQAPIVVLCVVAIGAFFALRIRTMRRHNRG
jgi:membrane protein DedA with SNARE-associated domain